MAVKETKVIISAETSKYERGMRDIRKANLKATRELKAQWKQASMVLAGVGVGVVALSKDFIGFAMVQERAELSLAAAMKAANEYTAKAHQGLKDYASGLQEVTEAGDEEILMLMTSMKNLGVKTERLKVATKMALGLATATDKSAATMARYVAMAEAGEFTMLNRLIPALKKTNDNTEKMRLAQEFAARSFDVARENAKTFSGTLRQMSNLWGDLKEALGDAFVKNEGIINLLNEGKYELSEWIDGVGRWVEVNDKMIAQDTERAISGIKSALSGLWDIINYDPAILQYGLIGLAIGGKKGAVMGASLGHMKTWIENLSAALGMASAGIGSYADIVKSNFEELEEIVKRGEAFMEGPQIYKVKIKTEIPTKGKDPSLTGKIPDATKIVEAQEILRLKQLDMEISREFKMIEAEILEQTNARIEKAKKLAEIETENKSKKLELTQEFNSLYNEMGLSQFELEKQRILDLQKIYEDATGEKIKTAEWAYNSIKDIEDRKQKDAEIREQEKNKMRMDTIRSASDGFLMMAEAQNGYSKTAFKSYKAFKLIEIAIATKDAAMKAYSALAGIQYVGPALGVAAAAAAIAFGTQQAANVQAMQPPSYDQGGISNAKGIYQTGNIAEAHIPIPSGGKIPVTMNDSGQRPVQIIMENPVFQDLETQKQVFVQIADTVARRVAPGAVVENYNNDGQIRSMVRGRR